MQVQNCCEPFLAMSQPDGMPCIALCATIVTCMWVCLEKATAALQNFSHYSLHITGGLLPVTKSLLTMTYIQSIQKLCLITWQQCPQDWHELLLKLFD